MLEQFTVPRHPHQLHLKLCFQCFSHQIRISISSLMIHWIIFYVFRFDSRSNGWPNVPLPDLLCEHTWIYTPSQFKRQMIEKVVIRYIFSHCINVTCDWISSTLLYPVSLIFGCRDRNPNMNDKDHLVGQFTTEYLTVPVLVFGIVSEWTQFEAVQPFEIYATICWNLNWNKIMM